MSIVDGRKRRRQRVAGKPAAVNPPPLLITALPYTIFFSDIHLVRVASNTAHQIRRWSNYVARTDCRTDRTNCNYRHPTIIPFRPHQVPIIGFKCMTSSYGPRFQWASCGGDEFSVAIYPFVRLIWQLSNLERAIWHDKLLWVKCTLLQFFGFSDKYANGLFGRLTWMKNKICVFIESTN